MEFGLSEEQQLLQDSVNRYLTDQVPLERVRQFADNREGRAADLISGLADLGAAGVLIPEEYGGVGLGPLEAAVVAEALGYRAAPVPFVAHAVMVPVALLAAGSPDQCQQWLPQIAAGERLFGAALGEANGARLGAAVTCRDGKLYGRSVFVLDFEADGWLVADVNAGLHMVAADASGLDRQFLETVDRSRPLGELVFNGVVGERLPGGNRETLARVLDHGRLMLAADTLGASQNMLDQAVAYAKQREQFNRVIASFQAVKHMCAEMAAQLEPVRAFVWYAAHALGEGADDARLTTCHLKAHSAEVGRFVAKYATEVHGGMGFTDLVGLHYWFKRIGTNRQLLGVPERLREEAARLQGLAV